MFALIADGHVRVRDWSEVRWVSIDDAKEIERFRLGLALLWLICGGFEGSIGACGRRFFKRELRRVVSTVSSLSTRASC